MEIGLALTARPRVLLLDEPLAGLAAAERERIVAMLIGALRGYGGAAGRARHRPRVRHRRHHHGDERTARCWSRETRKRCGRTGSAAGLPRQRSARRAGAARRTRIRPGRRSSAAARQASTPITARATSSTTSRSWCASTEVTGLLGPQRRRQVVDLQEHHGASSRRRAARSVSTASRSTAEAPSTDRARGHRPGARRAGGCSPASRWTRTCSSALSRGRRGRRRACIGIAQRIFGYFPRDARKARHARPTCFPAASSRWWRSPAPFPATCAAAAGRAVRGPAPGSGRGSLQVDRAAAAGESRF